MRADFPGNGEAMDGAIPTNTIKLTRTARIELAFPLDGVSWEQAGAGHGRLGVLRSVMHRLLNAAVTGLFANKHMRERDQANALAYIKREVGEIEDWARKKKVEHLKELRLPSNVTDALQSYANDKVQKYWKDKGKTRIPSMAEGAPIMVRDGGWELTLDQQGRFTYRVKLWDGRGEDTWMRFAVRATKDWHYSLLKRIATDPTVKVGSCQIVRDVDRKKWYAMLAFTTNDPAQTAKRDPGIVVALNRGRHNFLFAASNVAGKSRVLWPGEHILRTKQRTAAQRWERRRAQRIAGAGAKGHGKARRYREYEALGDYEARYVRTVCQQAAAALAAYAERLGAGRVLIEDFNTVQEDARYVPTWPWYQLKQAIAWACKKAGLALEVVPAEYISSTCSRCGNVDPAQHNLSTGTFHCKRCEFERPADLVASLNMLEQAGEDISGWRKGFKEADEFAAALKAGETPEASGDQAPAENRASSGSKKGGARKQARKPAESKRTTGVPAKGSGKQDG
jgi:transposase